MMYPQWRGDLTSPHKRYALPQRGVEVKVTDFRVLTNRYSHRFGGFLQTVHMVW